MKKKDILIFLWTLTAIFGITMIFSAGYIDNIISGVSPYRAIFKNIVILVSLWVFMRIVFYNNSKIYIAIKNLSKPIFYASLISLVAVLVIGVDRYNAKMVIEILGQDFQPLEFFKIAVIMYYASFFASQKEKLSLNKLARVSSLPLLGIGLIFLQPDLGGAMIITALCICIVLINGELLKELTIVLSALVALVVPLSYFVLQGYQADRIAVWLNPFVDAAGKGYQPIQAYLAIANSGLIGSGLMNSTQKTFLPIAQSDYIFAIICDELGIIGAFTVITLLVAIAFLSFSIATDSKDFYGRIYCFGFSFLILIQTFINIGGVTGVIPMTGVTLPFISDGVNSFVFLSIGLFIVVAVDNYNNKEKNKGSIDAKISRD